MEIKKNLDILNEDWSSGESETEFESMFTYLSTEEKMNRIVSLWLRTFIKAKAAALLKTKYWDIQQKIRVHGSIALERNM